ncbi:TonB family protein [Cytophagaceae bacterium 50C-KIRBA]|uniref:TonB family protein n=1 Tax=Aquirufa beregesia TaxID=2516556 RepID=A0ABX0ET82_9BACT|nr:M56 family metallopeptidase [Aquirufa beregesia]NGZ43675.1 TonB family protein [Aquirufa beregesia]
MMNNALLIYLLKSSLISGIFYGYYVLVLRNTRFHTYNRFYLLASMLISLVIPILQFSFFSVDEKEITGAGEAIYLIAASASTTPERFSWLNLPWLEYGIWTFYLISVSLLSYFLYQVVKIYQMKRRNPSIHMDGFQFIETDEEDAPFSFLQFLFWKKSISISEPNGQAIFKHELTHIQQKHTIDRVICQIITSVCWINPFYWLMHKELQNIHEFIADQEAVGSNNVNAFAQMILQSHYGNHFLNPGHSFYYSSIKRRIIMLTTSKNTPYAYLRKVLALPLAALAIFIFSIQVTAQEKNEELSTSKIGISIRNAPSKPMKGKKTTNKDLPPPPPPPLSVRAIPAVPAVPPVPPANPLYVVDGKIERALVLNKMNPNDIQSVNVLKGAMANEKYGQDGINGVVEISTKKNATTNISINQNINTIVEEPATFPGGPLAFQAFLSANLKYPEEAKKANISGKAYVQFTVTADGTIADISVLRSPGYGLAEEAIRIIKDSGKWIPAKNHDANISSKIVQPIAFSLGK